MRSTTGAIVFLALCCPCPGGEGGPAKEDEDVQVIQAMLVRFDAPKLDSAARRKLLAALGAFGPKAKDAVPRVLKFLEEELARRSKENPRYLADGSAENVLAAVTALGNIGPPAVTSGKTLIGILKDVDGIHTSLGSLSKVPTYRREAAWALGQIGAKEALIELRVSAAGDTAAEVRKAAGEAVAVLKAAPAKAPPAGATGTVSGRITYKGRPLPGGVISFVSAKWKFRASIHPDGTYQVERLPAGEFQIAIDPQPAGKAPAVLLPALYADPSRSGLRYELRNGAQTFDIELK